MTLAKRFTYIFLGPVILLAFVLLLSDALTLKGAQAFGLTAWLIFWWITRPVHITITAFMPVIMNALLDIVPMGTITAQYVSESIILVFGAGLLTMPWSEIGLDRRIALKTLSVVGSSMKSQITVWLCASVLFSTVLPNLMICALFTPIAVAMLKAAGYDDVNSKAALPIMLCVGWGVSLGGAGTPVGGAMNLAAISYLEAATGQELFYIDWVIRVAPYLITATILLLGMMLYLARDVKSLNGTKEYFTAEYAKLGIMKRDEKICISIFGITVLGAFARPLYADIVPALAPAYLFLIGGSLAFFIVNAEKKFMLSWESAQSKTMWGMMILFASGLALGKLLTLSGGTVALSKIIISMNLDGGFVTVVIISVAARVLSELTNGTTAAAMTIPLVLEFTTAMGLDPMPYWFITTFAYNSEFLLPLSVRAVTIGAGVDPEQMFSKGIMPATVSLLYTILFGYATILIWPTFLSVPYLTFGG